jgi:hypothetical protein
MRKENRQIYDHEQNVFVKELSLSLSSLDRHEIFVMDIQSFAYDFLPSTQQLGMLGCSSGFATNFLLIWTRALRSPQIAV